MINNEVKEKTSSEKAGVSLKASPCDRIENQRRVDVENPDVLRLVDLHPPR